MSVAYGEQQRNSNAFGDTRFGATAPTPNPSQRDLERQYHVVLQDSLGHPALGFKDGTWFRLTVSGPQPLQLRGAIRHCPHAAGSIVQIACWWMRENPLQPRSLDLATELALTVGELVRACPADGLGSSSGDLLPMPAAMVAVAPAMPPAQALPPATQALPPAASQPQYPPQPGFGQQAFAPAAAGYQDASPAGSWFDPNDTSGTGGFPAIPPAPVMGARPTFPTAAPATPPAPQAAAATYQQARTPYPPAPQGYGNAALPQAALPASAPSYQPAPSHAAKPAAPPRPAAPSAPSAPRGYGEQGTDWDRPPAPRRPAPAQQQPQPGQPLPPRQPPAPRPVPHANGHGSGPQARPMPNANGSGPQPRPRPGQQPPRPEFRDERRDTFERRIGPGDQQDPGRSSDRGERLDRSSDRLDRSSDRLNGNGVPPRRPNPPQPRGTMGRRPATRPGRPSDR